jgi:tRNA dimethylallyltransferase
VEVALLTGRPLSWWQRMAKAEGAMRPWYVRLTAPRAILQRRIEERVHDMLDAGWVAEVQAVLQRGVASDAPGLDAVGYREVVRHLRGELPAKGLAEAITRATRRYAKRQETWFRHQLVGHEVTTLDAAQPADALAQRVAHLWSEHDD